MRGAAIAPFRALRYQVGVVGDLGAVWAPPYDVITEDGARELREKHPNNIVRITNPEGEGPGRYEAAARTLRSWIDGGVWAREARPAFYVHRHAFNAGGATHNRVGVWALLRLSPYGAGLVLPHERTMSGPRADRLSLMRACAAQLSPIFCICSDPDERVGKLLSEITSARPDERAELQAGESHAIWKVEKRKRVEELAGLLSDQLILIADGHHRYETALAYRDELIAGGAAETGQQAHEFVLVHLVPESDPGLLLLPTHRLVSGDRLNWIDAVLKASDTFDVVRLSEADLDDVETVLERESGRPTFALMARGEEGAWLLRLRRPDMLSSIPSVAFHEIFMSDYVGLPAEEQIARMAYVKDAGEALGRVRSGGVEAAALLAAANIGQVRDAAAAGERMPPKTTYFWPKVPTGVAVHVVDPSEVVGGEEEPVESRE